MSSTPEPPLQCPSCSTNVSPKDRACPNCGHPLPYTGKRGRSESQYSDYLIWSILVTLLCCMPLGIVAIVYSVRADIKAKYGDLGPAAEDARKARKWCYISVGLMVAMMVLYAVAIALSFLFGAFSNYGR